MLDDTCFQSQPQIELRKGFDHDGQLLIRQDSRAQRPILDLQDANLLARTAPQLRFAVKVFPVECGANWRIEPKRPEIGMPILDSVDGHEFGRTREQDFLRSFRGIGIDRICARQSVWWNLEIETVIT